MRELLVSKWLNYYTVKYLRFGSQPWNLRDLSMKTHGLVSFPDTVFLTEPEAIDYATTIAEQMAFHFNDKIKIKINNKEIIVDKQVAPDVESVMFSPPSVNCQQVFRANVRKVES